MFIFLEKLLVYLKSIIVSVCYKIRYGKQIRIGKGNSTRGTLNIWIDKESMISLGDHLCSLGPTYFKSVKGGKLQIGKNCFFNRNCSITSVSSINIGDNCTFANNLVMVDHDHNIYSDRTVKPYTTADITIEDDVWIGANVTVLKGVTIGKGAVIAAGAVVVGDVEKECIYAGVPAKKIKHIEKLDEKNEYKG